MLSRALHEAAQGSRLIEVPGGHHRSVQHDPELQAAAVRFLVRAAKAGRTPLSCSKGPLASS